MNFAGKWKCVKRENIREMYTHMGKKQTLCMKSDEL